MQQSKKPDENVIPLRTPEDRVNAVLSLVKQKADPRVEIRTVQDALAWGDSWQAAYRQYKREAQKLIDELADSLMMARVDITITRAEKSIACWDRDKEIERLRGLL